MSRIEGVDIFRLIAITAVIAIHTHPFSSTSPREYDVFEHDVWKYLSIIMDQFARFAVPFFFVISGYFWGLKLKNSVAVAPISISIAKRITYILLVWSIIYVLPYNLSAIGEYGFIGPIKVAYWNIIKLAHDPVASHDARIKSSSLVLDRITLLAGNQFFFC